MITGLDDLLHAVEDRRRRLEVFSASPERAAEVAAQFETKAVSVSHVPLPPYASEDFLVLRDSDGEFLATLGRPTLDRLLLPEVHPPWVLAERDRDVAAALEFLDETLFASFDRSQMLATAREIEERDWRVADGRLYVGFQRQAAFEAQADVYDHLADRGDLSIRVFLAADWDVADDVGVPATVSDADEIGDFWFLAFDGAGAATRKCALVAEEREEGQFYGFWTYDPAIVDDLFAYLDAEYPAASADGGQDRPQFQ